LLEKYLKELKAKCHFLKGLIKEGHHYEGIHHDLAGLKDEKSCVRAEICHNKEKLEKTCTDKKEESCSSSS